MQLLFCPIDRFRFSKLQNFLKFEEVFNAKALLTKALVSYENTSDSSDHINEESLCKSNALFSVYCSGVMSQDSLLVLPLADDRFELIDSHSTSSAIQILIIILAYNSKGNEILYESLARHYDGLCSPMYETRIIVQTADPWTVDDYERLVNAFICSESRFDIDIMIYSEELRNMLSIEHRSLVQYFLNEFDLFIYQEDDIAVNRSHIDHFLSYSSLVPNQLTDVVGFTRFERVNASTAFTCETCDFDTSYQNGGNFLIESPFAKFKLDCGVDGEPFLVDDVNPHQGFWMLRRDQINYMVNNDCDFFQQDISELSFPRYIREYMSSLSIFQADSLVQQIIGVQDQYICHKRKVIPAKYWMTMSVHHVRQRYAEGRPILTVDHALFIFLTFAKDLDARQRGEVPACWQRFVDDMDLQLIESLVS